MSIQNHQEWIQHVLINTVEKSHHLGTVMSKEIWVEVFKENKWHRGALVTVNYIWTPSHIHMDHHNIVNMVKCNKEKNNLRLQGPTHMVTMVKHNIDIHLLQVSMVPS